MAVARNEERPCPRIFMRAHAATHILTPVAQLSHRQLSRSLPLRFFKLDAEFKGTKELTDENL